MYKFKCPRCSRRCKLNKKKAAVRGRPEEDRIYVWECDGMSHQAPHLPIRYVVETLEVEDGKPLPKSKLLPHSKRERIIKEQAISQVVAATLKDDKELTDQWRQWMLKQRYRNLQIYAGKVKA